MTREEFEQIDRQNVECDDFLLRIRERQPLEPNAEQRAVQGMVGEQRQRAAITAVLDECGFATVAATQAYIGRVIDGVAAEVGLIEKSIRKDLMARQDVEAAAWRVEIAALREEMFARLDAIEARIDEIEANQVDRSGASIAWLKRQHHAVSS